MLVELAPGCGLVLWAAALSSVVIGSFGAFRCAEIRRLLAYSAVAQTGFVFLGDALSAQIYL